MTARLGRVVLGLALLLTGSGLAGSPAAADGTYPASVHTRTEVVTDPPSPVRVGLKIDAVATVTSDVASASRGTAVAPGPPPGSVELSVDGTVIAVLPVGDGTVRAPIPARLRTVGDHVVAAEYIPAEGSVYLPSSDTYDLRVFAGSGIDAGGGQESDDGVLPNTGGVWLGFLLLGLLAIAVGSYLVDRHRKQARRRRRNRPFVPADLPEELKV